MSCSEREYILINLGLKMGMVRNIKPWGFGAAEPSNEGLRVNDHGGDQGSKSAETADSF